MAPQASAAAGAPRRGRAFERVIVRLTATGAAAVALLLAAGIVAVNSGNNLLFLVVASLLALFALSGVLGHTNLRSLGVRVAPPGEIYAGQPASCALLVANPRRRVTSFLVSLSGHGPGGTILELAPGRSAPLPLLLTFPARGRRPWPLVRVTSEFPFGLIERGGLAQPEGTCLVYPRPLAVPWEVLEGAEREGDHASRNAPGVDGDYRGLRAYLPGDRLSRIRWSSWLSRQRLETKEFEAEGGAPVTFTWTGVPGPGPEERLGQLTWLVRTALRRGRSVGIALPGRVIQPGAGPAHRAALLEALALHGETS